MARRARAQSIFGVVIEQALCNHLSLRQRMVKRAKRAWVLTAKTGHDWRVEGR
jgi:hypothetical protein